MRLSTNECVYTENMQTEILYTNFMIQYYLLKENVTLLFNEVGSLITHRPVYRIIYLWKCFQHNPPKSHSREAE